jgi:hypothetical protein
MIRVEITESGFNTFKNLPFEEAFKFGVREDEENMVFTYLQSFKGNNVKLKKVVSKLDGEITYYMLLDW